MRIRLIKKLAEMIDGIDLSAVEPGDVLDPERSEARLLIIEGSGFPEARVRREYASAAFDAPALAADRPS